MAAPDLFSLFTNLKQKSSKVDSYFSVYQSHFEKYRGKADLTFVEIGVLNGGSLLMWRDFFGPSARIIGVDYSPGAQRMREKGFEIFIGDQGSPEFWEEFYRDVGPIDILLDDGGHTNRHQIVTVESALNHIKDGGLILIEDTFTSYLPRWGNPSAYSFMNYAKSVGDRLQARSPNSPYRQNKFSAVVYSVSIFESIVGFHIDRRLCKKASILNVGIEDISAINYWDVEKRLISHSQTQAARRFLRRIGLEAPTSAVFRVLRWIRFKFENFGLRK